MTNQQLNELLGNIDVYLLDQILKGRFDNCTRLLDAGCGEGRNSRYLATLGKEICFLDREESAIRMVRMMFRQFPSANFVIGDLREIPFKDESFDGIICSAVLHFASDPNDFRKMWLELMRILRPGGFIFIRMSTEVGLDQEATFPFNLSREDFPLLEEYAEWAEPFKTVLVKERSMGVLALWKK